MIDDYVNCIRQVATLLGYEELQVLEVFKNIIPNRLYWILYPIDNLGLAVETAKRVYMKEINIRTVIHHTVYEGK